MNTPAATRPRLSVAIIVRNNAPGLAHTMMSVEGIADEVIVVDTGSSDSSREVAAQHGAIVIEFEWCDDFSAARNEALRHTSGNWVLWLDAGETFSKEDAQGLRAELDQGLDASRAYLMMVQLPPAEGIVAAEQIARLRLLPADSRIRFQGRVRESALPVVDNLGLTLEGLPYRIARPASDHQSQVKLLRARRNLNLTNAEMMETGRQPHLLNCMAEALQGLGEVEESARLYQEAIDASATGSSELLEAYYGALTALDTQPESRQQQIALCVDALEQFPLDSQLLCAMGGYLQGEGRLDLAERSYRTVIEHGQVNPLLWHIAEIHEIAAVCLSLTLQLQQREAEAVEVLQQTTQRFPHSQRVRRALLELLVKQGRGDEAVAQVDYFDASPIQQEQLRGVVRGAALAAGKDWLSARTYLQIAHQSGCADTLCLRWLSLTYIVLGQHNEARQLLDQWQQIEPHSAEAAQFVKALEEAVAAAPAESTPPGSVRFDNPQQSLGRSTTQPGHVPHS